jgi:hypothetical protein
MWYIVCLFVCLFFFFFWVNWFYFIMGLLYWDSILEALSFYEKIGYNSNDKHVHHAFSSNIITLALI